MAQAQLRKSAQEGLIHTTQNGYFIQSYLGSGTSGLVFKAEKLFTKPTQIFAIKVLFKSYLDLPAHQKELDRLNSERLLMTRIRHPNIVHCYEFFEDKSFYFMVLQFFESGD
jgi:serine/threonine protein kinase